MLAITGASGVGKSSLVNAFRRPPVKKTHAAVASPFRLVSQSRLRDSDANAAATGVKETTPLEQQVSAKPLTSLDGVSGNVAGTEDRTDHVYFFQQRRDFQSTILPSTSRPSAMLRVLATLPSQAICRR